MLERFVLRSVWHVVLAGGLCVATAMLVWLGYRATLDSQHGMRLLLERRVAEQLALLSAGLAHDMSGAYATVLVPVTPRQLAMEPPHDLADAFARGFARFPYPESFFVWKATNRREGLTYFFNRTDRPPPWHAPDARLVDPFPVEVVRNPKPTRRLVHDAQTQARYTLPFAVFETTVDAIPYQVIVNLLYRTDGTGLAGMAGFTVNLQWARQAYFHEVVPQLAQIGGKPEDVSLQILDESGALLLETQPHNPTLAAATRAFPLIFFDRALIAALPQRHLALRTWTARASASREDRPETAAALGDGRFLLISLAGIAAMVGLVVTSAGMRLAAELVTMKSEFVSSVTHELKMPLAVICLTADTLARGRYESADTIRDYCNMLSQQGKHLTRLIDNLLMYARLSDTRSAYLFEAADVGELVHETLERFRIQLSQQRFTVEIDIPTDVPQVRADRSALIHVLNNVIDNAIKYSNNSRTLTIAAVAADDTVCISIADRGIGIPTSEIDLVSEKFFRGRRSQAEGSGLGLAIARRIIEAHQGRLKIASDLGQGTRVDLVLPVGEACMNQRVLIVEDDADLARVLTDNLAYEGFTVEWAADGRQALHQARLVRPDVVILDLMIPGLTGFEVCRSLSTDLDHIPIIISVSSQPARGQGAWPRDGRRRLSNEAF